MSSYEVSPLIPSEQESTASDLEPLQIRNTKIRFTVVAVFAFLGLLVSPIESLIFYALAYYISSRLFKNHIIERFSNGEISREKLLWFVSIGLERASLWRVLTTIFYSLLVGIIPIIFILSSNPVWFQDILYSLSSFNDHGEIINVTSRIARPLSILNRLYTTSSDIHYFLKPKLLKGGIGLISKTLGFSRSFESESEFDIPILVFEDGTDARPLLGNFLLSLSRIPLWLLLHSSIVDAFIVRALPREGLKSYFTKKFALTPLRSTLQNIVASSASIGLGMCIFDWVFVNAGGIISAGAFWLDAAMQIFTGALIGIALHQNSETLYTDEKKSVLLEPVLFRGIYNLTGNLIGIAFLKIVLPIIGEILIRGSGSASDFTSLPNFMVFIVLMVIANITLVVFVTRKSIDSFKENTQII